MYLVTNGCSHTSGAELEYELQDSCYEKAWPKHLANLLQCSSINLAKSGASQDRIIRTTLCWLGNNLDKIKDCFIIILWPGPLRTEIRADGVTWPQDDDWIPLVAGNDVLYKKQFPYEVYRYYESWLSLRDVYLDATNFLKNVISLQNTLKLYKIPYLFWNASSCIWIHDNRLSPLCEQIDNRYYPNFYEPSFQMDAILSTNGGTKNFQHWDEKTQRWWANFLYNYTQKNYTF